MIFRRFVDIRTTPLLVGYLQFSLALVPLTESRGQLEIYAVLSQLQYGNWWMAIGLTLGFFLMAGAVLKWRAMLLWCEATSCVAWAATFAPFIDQRMYTPMTLAIPVLSVLCLLLAIREVAVGLNVRDGRCKREGFRTLQGAA